MDGQPMRQRQQSRHSTLHFMVLWRRHTTDAGDDDLLMYVQSSPAQTIVCPGSGPRHAVFHLTKPLLYVANELSSSLTVWHFDLQNGQIAFIKTITEIPDEYHAPISAAGASISRTDDGSVSRYVATKTLRRST